MSTGAILLGVFALALIAVIAGKATSKKKMLSNRAEKNWDQMVAEFAIPKEEQQEFRSIIEMISEAYHVPAGKLRPLDSFEGNLSELDSWNAGGGAETLTEKLKAKYSNIDIAKIKTVNDIVKAAIGQSSAS